MSIETRVKNAIQHFSQGDSESALHDICSAIEATCKRSVGTGGRSNYKRFVEENIEVITRVATGGMVRTHGVHVLYDHPNVPKGSGGGCSLQDILYHVVRCGLYHESSIPNDIVFHETTLIGNEDGILYLSKGFVLGLVVAVMIDPSNAEFAGPAGIGFPCQGGSIQFDQIWGIGKTALMDEFDKRKPPSP